MSDRLGAMAKPFRVTGPSQAVTIGRLPDGRFRRLEAPEPAEIRKEALTSGETVEDIVRAKRVPHHPVGAAAPKTTDGAPQPVYEDAVPWPEAGPVNDAGRMPMKLNR